MKMKKACAKKMVKAGKALEKRIVKDVMKKDAVQDKELMAAVKAKAKKR